MTKPTIAATLLAAVCLSLFCGCAKYEKEGQMHQPGIALTFDDLYIDDWYGALNLFDSFGVKATFYITRFQDADAEAKKKLHAIQDRGHEIGFHSTNHVDFAKYAQKEGPGRLIKQEIEDGLEMMRKDGFYPTTFAYPYGSHTETLNQCLLRRFRSIRLLNGSKNYAKSFVATTDNSVLYAYGIDRTSGKTNEEILNLVRLAKENHDVLVLVAHHIERKDTRMDVPYARLRKILTLARELNLKFYTVSEISRP